MGNRLRIHLLLFIIFLFLPVFTFTQEQKSISSLYIDQAIMSAGRGENERAYELLLSANSFMPDNSDGFYLLAKLDSTYPAGLYSSLDNCRKALDINVWKRFSPFDCRILLGELLARTGSYMEAESVLSDIQVDGNTGLEYFVIQSKVLLALGKTGESVSLLDQAVKKYPQEPRLKQLLLQVSPSFRGRLAGEYLENRYHFNHNDTVLLDLIRQPLAANIKEGLIDIYLSAGGKSPWVYLELIATADEETDLHPYIDSLYENGGIGNGVLLDQLIPLIVDTPLFEYLQERIAGYSGALAVDSNNDGYDEILYRFEDGLPRTFTVDSNQDGLHEYDAVFEKGIPITVTGVIDNRIVELNYSNYPFAENLIVRSGEKKVTYVMPPGEFSYPLFDFRFLKNQGPLNRPRLNSYRPQVSQASVRSSAIEIKEEYAGTPDMVVLWEYLPGGQSWQKKEMDGKGKIIKKFLYQDGKPIHAGVDSNRDGEFEVTYQYEQGSISAILFDENGDSIPEYSMVFGDEDTRRWDFNGDSIIDCTELVGKNGQVLRTFSSGMDGVFDMEMLYDNNRIQWISRNGLRKEVSQDASGRFYWVGEKHDLIMNPLPPAGMHFKEGYSLSVFNQFGNTYIEVIE